MKLLALTGGPGCGKSTVAKIFSNRFCWNVIDTDAICHALYDDADSGLPERFCNLWGNCVLDVQGKIDRKKIAEIVFEQKQELKKLNEVVHPEIMKRIRQTIANADSNARLLFDVPLLFETNWPRFWETSVCVWASPGVQRTRLLARGWDWNHAEHRIKSQLPAEQKLAMADFGIINNGSLEFLEQQCAVINHSFSDKLNSPDTK